MPLDRVGLDKICDYVPFVSSFTNVIDLVQKKRFKSEEVKHDPPPLKSKYVTYIEHKSDLRCAILLFPIVGNVLVGAYDILRAFVSLFKENKNAETSDSSNLKLVGPDAPKPKNPLQENAPSIPLDSPLTCKLEEIPTRKRRAYLETLGFTSGFYADNDEFARRLLGSLSRNSSINDPLRKELKFDGSETEYLQFIRELPEEKVMDILIKETSKKSVFRQSLLEFLMLDPRLKFNAYINDNLSELAISMVAADEKLRDRLSPLIKNP